MSDTKPTSETSEAKPPTNETHWQMRLAVISTVATVLALIVPFVVPSSGKSPDSSESIDNQEESRVLPKPKDVLKDAKRDLEKLKEDIKKDFGPPKLPFPGNK